MRDALPDFLEAPIPPHRPEPDDIEQMIEGWFAYEQNFQVFDDLNSLCDEDPRLALSIVIVDRSRGR